MVKVIGIPLLILGAAAAAFYVRQWRRNRFRHLDQPILPISAATLVPTKTVDPDDQPRGVSAPTVPELVFTPSGEVVHSIHVSAPEQPDTNGKPSEPAGDDQPAAEESAEPIEEISAAPPPRVTSTRTAKSSSNGGKGSDEPAMTPVTRKPYRTSPEIDRFREEAKLWRKEREEATLNANGRVPQAGSKKRKTGTRKTTKKTTARRRAPARSAEPEADPLW